MISYGLILLPNQAIAVPQTSLKQLIKIAIDRNATLKSKRLTWKILIQKYPQAIALNDPTLNYSESLFPIETRLGSIDRVISLNQKLPYPGKLALRGAVVKQEIKIAKIRYDQASRDLVIKLKKAFHELIYLENALNISLKNKTIIEKITHIATHDYARDVSTLNDVAKAQSQVAQVAYDVQLLKELRTTEKTRINTLLNRHPEYHFKLNTFVHRPAKLPHRLSHLYRWAATTEEIKIASLGIDKTTLQRQLARYAHLPDFNVGLRYTQIGSTGIKNLSNDGDDALSLNIGINIPLNVNKNNAIKEQARLTQRKLIEERKALIYRLRNQVKGLYFKLNNSHRLITLYADNLIPQANRAMQIAERQYRDNKGSISNYLTTQSTGLNFQLAYYRALADYAKNIAEMERLTGRTL